MGTGPIYRNTAPDKFTSWIRRFGCYDCGMNIWNMPEHGQWPKWDLANEPPADIWERPYDVEKDDLSRNPYTPYDDLLQRTHPNGFHPSALADDK